MLIYIGKGIYYIFIILILFINIRCSSYHTIEDDLKKLSANYFIEDSVNSTPVIITLNWKPNESDRIKIDVKAGLCSDLYYKSEWQSDSSISIKMDTGNEQFLKVFFSFDLSSFYPYDIYYSVSIDGHYLLNEKMELYKTSGSKLTYHNFNSFLPLFKSSGLIDYGSTLYVCPDYPLTFIRFMPDCYDEASPYSIGLRDRFTLKIDSKKNNVIFYNKLLRMGAGNTLEVGVNEISKYCVLLNEPKEKVVDDTIKVIFSNSNLNYEFKYIVLKDSPSLIKIKDLVVQFNKNMALPGDTLIIIPSFLNENFENEFFNADTEFQVLLRDGCEVSDLVSPDREVSKYFPAVKQPIKLVIHDQPKNKNINVLLEVYPGYKYEANMKY